MSSIPNSVMPHAVAVKPKTPRRRSLTGQLLAIAIAPTFIALGAGVVMFEHVRRQFVRGWSNAEG